MLKKLFFINFFIFSACLLSSCADEDKDPFPLLPLFEAAKNGNLKEITYLLDLGTDVNLKDSRNETALHLASQFGHADTVSFLISKGADIHGKNNRGWTALLSAVSRDQTKIVKLLLQKGADTKDIIDCKSIIQDKTIQNLSDFVLNICKKAQIQHKKEKAMQNTAFVLSEPQGSLTIKEKTEEERDSKKVTRWTIGARKNQKTEQKKEEETLKIFFDFIKHILPFFDSERELIEKVERLCTNIDKTPLRLKQVVYQSVKAPQIESLDKEDEHPFNDYDLVQGKPAGVIVSIQKRQRAIEEFQKSDNKGEEILKNFEFSLSLKIDGERQDEILCSKNLKKEDVNYKADPYEHVKEVTIETLNENCFFSWEELKRDGIYKFINLPTEDSSLLPIKTGQFKIEIVSQLKHKNSIENTFVDVCKSSKQFRVNMLEPKQFKVLFSGFDGPYCGGTNKEGNPKKAFETTELEVLNNYLHSKEVKKDFYDMFPVSTKQARKPSVKLMKDNKRVVLAVGSCTKGIKGIFKDILNLQLLNLKYKGDRIIGVFKENYKEHHKSYFDKIGNIGNIVGLAFPNHVPSRYIFLPFYGDIFFGSNIKTGVVLVQEKFENKALFLHELAHSFGQLKEYYQLKDRNGKIKKEQFYCSQFTPKGTFPETRDKNNNLIGKPCYDYRVVGGLVKSKDYRPTKNGIAPRKQTWKLLNNQYSIMHGSAVIRNWQNIYKRWIDRETYQKILFTLQNNLKIPEEFFRDAFKRMPAQKLKIDEIKQKVNNIVNCNLQKRPVIAVSGIYSKSQKDRLTSFSVKALKIKSEESLFPSGELFIEKRKEETNHIKIQLEKNGRLEGEAVLSRDSYIEIYRKDGSVEKQQVDTFPFFTSFFPTCNAFSKDTYKISVKETYIENGIKKDRVLIDSIPVKWKQDIDTKSSGDFVDNIAVSNK